jgi:hypothetical protein
MDSNTFGSNPREYISPLENGDHLEIKTTTKLDINGKKKYQTMIGCLQWAVSLGRLQLKMEQ